MDPARILYRRCTRPRASDSFRRQRRATVTGPPVRDLPTARAPDAGRREAVRRNGGSGATPGHTVRGQTSVGVTPRDGAERVAHLRPDRGGGADLRYGRLAARP